MKGGMDAVDGGRGETGTLTGARADPAARLERVVEFSQICCRDLGELLVPQAGFDVMLHITCPKPARNCREGGSPTDLPDCHPGNSIVY